MMFSPAWRSLSINACRILEFLLIEHRNHAFSENGNLIATYAQLVKFGVVGSEIFQALDELEFVGLVKSERGGRWADTNQPSRFRVTFYADKNGNSATNEWGWALHELSLRFDMSFFFATAAMLPF
jgi:hypothetical protein